MALPCNMCATSAIRHMKSIFARHGIPTVTVLQLYGEYDFQHVTLSPLYAQSNGKAEKGVHIIKQLLKKTQISNSATYLELLSILSYRTSPLEHGMSPAELLMGWRLRHNSIHCTKETRWDKNGINCKRGKK